MLSWSLCIATYNRAQVLERCVACALAQSRPPSEIVIVDSSDDWAASRDTVATLCTVIPGLRLVYEPSTVKSSAAQRNHAVDLARGDVLFLIDDDSLMQRDCAERVMTFYERDGDGRVVGVCAVNTPDAPPEAKLEVVARKRSGVRSGRSLRRRVLSSRLGRWINAKILIQNKEELFLPYEGLRGADAAPDWASAFDAIPVNFMPGYAMTVRRAVALRERFETSLRYYTAFEDLDASYRYRRHGLLIRLRDARLHHYEAASGRVSRTVATTLQLLNMLVFIKRNAADPAALLVRYRLMLIRRLAGETIKDLVSGRWSLPQAAGVLAAMRSWRQVYAVPAERLDVWYPDFQSRLISADRPRRVAAE